jgi:hypothetical protein
MSDLITTGTRATPLHSQDLAGQAIEAWALIPREAQDALLVAAADAVQLAETGGVEAGRQILITALRGAEDNWKGNPWGEELVLCHQEVLDRYTRRYVGNDTP